MIKFVQIDLTKLTHPILYSKFRDQTTSQYNTFHGNLMHYTTCIFSNSNDIEVIYIFR